MLIIAAAGGADCLFDLSQAQLSSHRSSCWHASSASIIQYLDQSQPSNIIHTSAALGKNKVTLTKEIFVFPDDGANHVTHTREMSTEKTMVYSEFMSAHKRLG